MIGLACHGSARQRLDILLFGTDRCARISLVDQAGTMSSIKDNSLHRLLVEFFDLPTNTRSRDIRQEFLSNWGSLAMVQLITELERRFSVEFDLEEIHRLRSYAEIRETVSRKGLVFENSATLPG